MSTYFDHLYQIDLDAGSREAAMDASAAAGQQFAKTPMSKVFDAAWRQESLAYGIWKRTVEEALIPDPSYRMTAAEVKELGTDIPEQHHSKFMQATSRAHAERIRDNIKAELEDQRTLESAGALGTGLQMGAGILDPVQAVTAVVTGPMAAYGHASKLTRFVKGGAAVAAQNAAIEVALGQQQYIRDPAHIVTAAATGFLLGGGLGLLTRGENLALAAAAARLGDETTLATVTRHGLPLDPNVKVVTEEALRNYTRPDGQSWSPVRLGADGSETAFRQAYGRQARDRFMASIDAVPREVISAEERGALNDLLFRSPTEAPKAPEGPFEWPKGPATPDETPTVPGATPHEMQPVGGADRSISAQMAEVKARLEKARAFDAAEAADMAAKEADYERALRQRDLSEAAADEAAFLEGSVGSAQVARIGQTDTWGKVKAWANRHLRIDIFQKVQNSSNPILRGLGLDTLADAVGAEGRVARHTATEFAQLTHKASLGELKVAYEEAGSAWQLEKGFSVQERADPRHMNPFFDAVTLEVWGHDSGNVHVKKAAAATREMHARYLKEMQRLGIEGVEDVALDPKYMMRRFNQARIQNLLSRFSAEQLETVIAGAVRAAVRDMTDEKARALAKGYLATVRQLPYEEALSRRPLTKFDYDTGHEAIVKGLGLDPKVATDVLDTLHGIKLETTADGLSPRLRDKVTLDETFRTRLVNSKGMEEEVRMADFFITDARDLSTLYSRQVSGLIGYAKVGIKSSFDWETKLREARSHAAAKGLDHKDTNDTIRLLEMARKWAMGYPLEHDAYGNVAQYARMLGSVNFIRLMGQTGAAQVAEIGNLTGLAGARAVLLHSPALKDLKLAAINGKLAGDSQLRRDLNHLIGVAADASRGKFFMRDIFETEFDAGLSKVEQGLSYGRAWVSRLSGLEGMNIVLKQVGEAAFAQRMADIAHGIEKLTPALRHKLATDGLADDALDEVVSRLQKHTKMVGADKKLEHIDYTAWSKESPKSLEDFRMAVFRQVNRAIQEPTIGETASWMHSTVGKLLTQFRGFGLVAYGKQFLYGLNHMDVQTSSAWFLSAMFGSASYIAQTSINYAHDREKMEKRLSLDNIAKAAVQRSGFIPMFVPFGLDAAMEFTGHKPVFAGTRSSGLSGALMGVPSVDLGMRLWNTTKAVSQELTNPQHVWTQNEVRSGLTTVIPNLWLFRNFVDAASSSFPKEQMLDSR